MSKQDKKIASQDEKMSSELTWDAAVDSVITTPQSEWSPYQIAVANLNPDLKSKNKRYQNALNTKSILENERVNLWQAWELMMNAYRNAINYADSAAEQMMNANSANAAIQAWAMTSWSAWLATNPAAAAQTRLAAQNQATIQNMQIRSNADQNIANAYSNMSQIPATLTSIASSNAQMDDNAMTTVANSNLANAQANYYNKQASSVWTGWWSSRSSSSSNSTTKEEKEEDETLKNFKDALAKYNISSIESISFPKWEWDIRNVEINWTVYKDPDLYKSAMEYWTKTWTQTTN